MSWDPIERLFPKFIGYPLHGGWASIVIFFSEIQFFRKAQSHLSTFLGIKLVHVLIYKQKNTCLLRTPQNAKFFPKRCLIKPFLKNSTQTISQGSTPRVTQILNNVNVWMVLYCAHKLLRWSKITTLYPPSLSKAGPFTLESHIAWKASKRKVSQKEDTSLNPFEKKAPKQFLKEVPHEWPRSTIM